MLYIRYDNSFVLRGFLISVAGSSIRVALEECGDAAEYRRVGDGWVSENGETVEIELQPAPEAEPFRLDLTMALQRTPSHYCVV